MKLQRVDITNFRSIQSAKVIFNPRCRVLVGINESGKSNVLKALSFLGENYKPVKKDDMREALPEEDLIKKSEIMFVFDLEKQDTESIYELTSKYIATSDKAPNIVTNVGSKYSLDGFCNTIKEGLYCVNVINESKNASYWSFNESYKLADGWKKPSDLCPTDFTISVSDELKKLSEFRLIKVDNFKDIPEDYVVDAEISDLTKLIGTQILSTVTNNLPNVLFWEYNEENLLPNAIDISQFSISPDMCPPLKNMFSLAGISDIKGSIEDKRKGSDTQFQNYLDAIAKKTTLHFKNVWKEYKEISFSLRLNGNLINPGIKEKNTHDFITRSDGFKRFITFLIMISVGVQTDEIQNTLLLIDEPDASLHPSGCRYLRDELIRISRNNYVVYSTHSIFMIDTGDIARHYIVKKKKEISTIEPAGDSNISDEEVIYNALGFSIFSILKIKNLIFEGWNDKHIFLTYLGGNVKIKNKFKDVGVCHAKGAKNIKTITPMIELANRKCLIISDSDSPSKDEQKLYNVEKGYGNWKTYQDLDKTLNAITGEDFIKNDHIVKNVRIAINDSNLSSFDANILPPDSGKLEAIRNWLIKNGLTDIQARSKLKEIKVLISHSLKASDIENEYKKLVDAIDFNK